MTVTVNEAGAISTNPAGDGIAGPSDATPPTPAGTIYFMALTPNRYAIAGSGYPIPTIGAYSTLPSGSTAGTAAPLPSGVSFTSTTPDGTPSPLGILQGTPAASTANTTWPINFAATNAYNGSSVPFTNMTLHVVAAGDVNHDGTVDCTDVAAVQAALNAKYGQAKFNYYADVNHDNVVNVLDLSFVSSHLAAGTKCTGH